MIATATQTNVNVSSIVATSRDVAIIAELQEENALLWQANNHLQQEVSEHIKEIDYLRNQVDFHRTWRKDLDHVKQEVLPAGEKATVAAIYSYIRSGDILPNVNGYYLIDPAVIASMTGASITTVRTHIANVADAHEDGKPDRLAKYLPLFDKRIVKLPMRGKDGGFYEVQYLKPLTHIATPKDYPQIARNLRTVGGPGKGQGRPQKCQCGGDLVEKEQVLTKQVTTTCNRCKHEQIGPVERVSEPLPVTVNHVDFAEMEPGNHVDFDLDAQEVSAVNHVDFAELVEEELVPDEEELVPENNQPDAVTSKNVLNQVDLLVDAIVLSNNPPPKLFSLDAFLLQRIGHGQLIYSTGSLITSDKYFSFKTGHVPELEKYLKGDRDYIYGSRLLLADGGRTNVLSFDIDIKYPELYARRMEFMLFLAAAGIAVCAWLRRNGSVHIEVYFSSPVDAAAAYAFLCDVCPALREIVECYPVADKADCALSWPFYYRIDATVFPCALEYIPAYGTSVKKHPGIKADRNGLTAILAECITPASLIPALPIVVESDNPAQHWGGGLLDIPRRSYPSAPYGCTSDGLGTAVIADWNASHSWEYVTGQTLCNGFFSSPFRTDSDPSVKVNANGTAKDFGPGGAYMDKFDWWIAFNHLDKTAEVKRLIAERKQEGIAS